MSDEDTGEEETQRMAYAYVSARKKVRTLKDILDHDVVVFDAFADAVELRHKSRINPDRIYCEVVDYLRGLIDLDPLYDVQGHNARQRVSLLQAKHTLESLLSDLKLVCPELRKGMDYATQRVREIKPKVPTSKLPDGQEIPVCDPQNQQAIDDEEEAVFDGYEAYGCDVKALEDYKKQYMEYKMLLRRLRTVKLVARVMYGHVERSLEFTDKIAAAYTVLESVEGAAKASVQYMQKLEWFRDKMREVVGESLDNTRDIAGLLRDI